METIIRVPADSADGEDAVLAERQSRTGSNSSKAPRNLATSAMRVGSARQLAMVSGNPASVRVRHSSNDNRARTTDRQAGVSSDVVAAAEVEVAPAPVSSSPASSSPVNKKLVNSNRASGTLINSIRTSKGQAHSRMPVSMRGGPTGGLAARTSDRTASIRIVSRIPGPVVVTVDGNNDRSDLRASVCA